MVWLCCLLLLVSGCASSVDGAGKTFKVATEPAYPPFEFQAANGELQGFSMDLMNAVGSAGGFKVKFQSIPFDGIIPALRSKTVDAAISSITITEEREKVVSFSRPYFKAGLAIALKSNNQNITGLDSLKNKKIAVQIGTTGADKAKTVPGATIRSFDSTPIALQELANGNVDAVIADAAVVIYAINTGNLPRIKIINQLLTEEYYGIPVAKNSANLALVNRGLTTVLKNGTYNKIYQKWFHIQPPTLPEKLPFMTEKAVSDPLPVIIGRSLPILLQGALITLVLTIISTIFGVIAGSLIGIARLSNAAPVRWLAIAYIDFFRGTPLLVQLYMIYFGIPALVQELGSSFNFDPFVAGLLGLTLNGAAYIAEIMRAGIQSIDIGQSEAAQSLGLSYTKTMQYVIFPQALRRMLPPLGNEFISRLKDTSLVSVIGFEELLRKGQLIVANNYLSFEIYGTVAIIYLCLTLISSQILTRLEVSMNPIKKVKL